ncbi:MAG: hypothetical protein AAF802_09450 [Planctomycetota bacterium]
MTLMTQDLQRRRWLNWTILSAITVVTVGSAFLLFGHVESLHTVAAFVKIEEQSPPLLRDIAPTDVDSEERAEFGALQAELVRTPFVLMKAVRNLQAAGVPLVKNQEDPVSWLLQKLAVDFPLDGSLMRISMEGTDPEQLVEIVQAVCESYVEEVHIEDVNGRFQKLNTLRERQSRLNDTIRKKHSELRALAKALGVDNSDSARQVSTAHLVSFARREGLIREKLDETELEISLVNERKRLRGDENFEKEPDASSELEVLEAMKELLVEKLNVLEREKRKYSDSNDSLTSSIDMDLIREDLEIAKDVSRKIKMEIQLLEIELNRGSRVRLVSKATTIDRS